MGKQHKSKRFRHHKDVVTGTENEQTDFDGHHLETAISITANKLIESLSSPNAETRLCACASIANFASETYTELVNAGVVRILGSFLVDQNVTLRTTALGALRNLSLVGGVSICKEMVKNDVMTPLATLLKQLSSIFKSRDESEVKRGIQVFEQAVHLLWNLCESDELAVQILNKQQLCSVLLCAFTCGLCDVPVQTLIAQCLYTVAEDNEEVIKILKQDEVVNTLLEAIKYNQQDNQAILFRVVIAGILCSIADGEILGKDQVFDSIIAFLGTVLQMNCAQQMQEILEVLSKIKEPPGPALKMEAENPKDAIEGNGTECDINDDTMNTECAAEQGKDVGHSKDVAPAKERPKDLQLTLDTELEKKVEDVKKLIQAQQTALEIFTNLTCPQDEDEEWEDLEDSSDTSADELSMETDNTQASAMEGETLVSDEIVKVLLKHNMIDSVLAKCKSYQLIMWQNMQYNASTRSVCESLSRLRSSALVCLSNMIGVLTEDILKSVNIDVGTALFQIWSQIGEILNSAVSNLPKDADIAEASSSALRAVVDKLADFAPEKLQNVSEEDLRFLCTTELSCDIAETRVNLIRVVGCIGGALAEEETPHPHLRGIGEFFCEVCNREQEVWVLAECLDCIFDVFGEDHLNGILREIQLLDKLKAMVSSLKSKYQQQKKMLGDHLPIVSTAKTNLTRFIKYKTKVMK